MAASSLCRRWGFSLLAAAAALVCSNLAHGQPIGRWGHSAIYDPIRQRMLVFGGYDTDVHNDVWELTLGRDPHWRLLATAGPLPPSRMGHTAVYDQAGDQMVVFGGLDLSQNLYADVWALTLSDSTWSRLQPSGAGPAKRYFHSAIYDPVRKRMVVCGGAGVSSDALGDVWSLSLTSTPTWDSLETIGSMPARYGHSAIYDPVRDRMLVFGSDAPTNEFLELRLADDPPTWKPVTLGTPPPQQRKVHSAVYDPVGDRMIVFGGHNGNNGLNDVWEDSLASPTAAWKQLDSPTDPPSIRAYHSAVYDSAYRRMIVFGGTPNVSEPTWAFSLDQPTRWSPERPVIEVAPPTLNLDPVTVGDRVSVAFGVSNIGLLPLQVLGFSSSSQQGVSISPAAPAPLAWNETVPETLRLVATAPETGHLTVAIHSNDPTDSLKQVDVSLDVLGLEFGTHVLGDPSEVPLGVSMIVVATPRPGVHVERGTLYYRKAGATPFDSLALTPLSTDFIAAIPADSVTEQGVEYYVRVENSGFWATRPVGAPAIVDTQRVAAPTSFAMTPLPTTSGKDFLEGRAIDVEAILPAGANFDSGAVYYRRGGELDYQRSPITARGALRRPAAVIPDSMVGPRGLEYWAEVRTFTSTLRFPWTPGVDSIIRTKVQDLAEPVTHPGLRYRLLSVPLDFGTDFSGSLDDLLTDQLGSYDPVTWRSYVYDPISGSNVEFSASQAARFRPEPGRAFWLISRSDHRVDTKPIAGFSTRSGADYPVVLEPGWNLFGDPFDFPVAWSDVTRDPAVVSDPVAFDPRIGNKPGDIGGYVLSPPTVLEPFEGYFVHATRKDTLWVRAHAASAATPSMTLAGRELQSVAARAISASQAPWQLGLVVSTESATDGSSALGVQSGAVAGWDPFDQPKPPGPPGPWVRVTFVHPDWGELSGDYRCDWRSPGAEGDTWEVEVCSGTADEPIMLDLSELIAPPSSLAVRLIDREQGSAVDWMRCPERPEDSPARAAGCGALQHRIVSFGVRPYRLAIVAGTQAYVEDATRQSLSVPTRVVLDPSTPNPFRIATTIRFGLTHAAVATLEVFSVLGQRVATPLDREPLAPGYHAVIWDGRGAGGSQAPSGVYLVRLVAGKDVLTRRAVLVR